LIFSDSIVLSVEYPTGADETWKYAALGYLTLYSTKLFDYMFVSGLPLRGAIVEGILLLKIHASLAERLLTLTDFANRLILLGL
jgi:hypothetical protein